MFEKLSTIIMLVSLCGLSMAQVPFPGGCPDVKIPKTFDLDRYMGIWYEYSKYPFIFEIGKKCIYAKYTNAGNGTVDVMNASINRLTGTDSNITGSAKVIAPGELAVAFSSSQESNTPNYSVLGTDYNNYAVVYNCMQLASIVHSEVVWILTRERKPSADTIATAKKVIDDNKLSQTFLINTNQDDCPDINNADATTLMSLESTTTNSISKA